MAHYTRRPLYATTSGELSKKDSLERNLRDALRWSRRWRAIVLLDEADVFLAKRDVGTDMKRNETVTSRFNTTNGWQLLTSHCSLSSTSRVFLWHHVSFHQSR